MKNALYAQSGGATAVINSTACGVIEAIRKSKEINKIYAAENGIIGALNENLIDISLESDKNIKELKNSPSCAFGSCRYKMKSFAEDKKEYHRLIEIFKAHNIGYFFYNGGGDSADTCLKVSQLSELMNYPVKAIHIPKTIDNDLSFTDNCPGFGSVAKYVAVSTLEASIDVASMCLTSTKIFILEVMGRHAGWIAAAAGMVDKSIPVVIIFPEIKFKQQKFLDKVQENVKKFGYCTIVASEGAKNPDGSFLSEQGTTDNFGHTQLGGVAPLIANLIKQKLNYKYHLAIADYLQRSARHLASDCDIKQAYALGQAAVKMAIAGNNSIMPSIVRISNDPYVWDIKAFELKDIANVEKMMPRDFISADGFSITDKCIEYIAPLIAGENYPSYENGLPKYIKLKKIKVAKKLPEFTIHKK